MKGGNWQKEYTDIQLCRGRIKQAKAELKLVVGI